MRDRSNVLDINEARRRRLKQQNNKGSKKSPPRKQNQNRRNAKKPIPRKVAIQMKMKEFWNQPNTRILVISALVCVIGVVAVFFSISRNALEIYLGNKTVSKYLHFK